MARMTKTWIALAAASTLIGGGLALAADSTGPAVKGAGTTKAIDRAVDHDTLVLRTGSGTGVLSTQDGAWSKQASEGALIAPGTNKLIHGVEGPDTTKLVVTDPASGDVTEGAPLDGTLVANVVSGSGDYVALTPPRSPGATPWLPDGRRATKVVVAPLAAGEKPRTFDLRGNFEPEAFSVDDGTLFLIRYAPAMAPSSYSVRRLNLETGRVRPIARLKLAAPGTMRGTGRTQVLAPNKSELYTLYTQQGPNYVHGEDADHSPGSVHAFVHVLNLEDEWAHCVDLPKPFGLGRATASAVAVSPRGDRVYVADWTNDVIATINPHRLQVLDVAHVELGGRDSKTFAAATNEALFIGGDSQVIAFDTTAMTEFARWDAKSDVTGLAIAPDDRGVYVTSGDEVSLLDLAIENVLDTWEVEGLATVDRAFAVTGSTT
ncbi:MAG TPA: hypothetical protein VNC78_05675 [Actinomycetota bacterium]|nr:hypothetical protein [Actinomycetota bacterium]